mmetsp:Transcript_18966/g.52191  ORF Transcript_18966/g.52191 Transcript_18966/m.52191 type:complete len:83 (-) Transcript_18966:182-430(-)
MVAFIEPTVLSQILPSDSKSRKLVCLGGPLHTLTLKQQLSATQRKQWEHLSHGLSNQHKKQAVRMSQVSEKSCQGTKSWFNL